MQKKKVFFDLYVIENKSFSFKNILMKNLDSYRAVHKLSGPIIKTHNFTLENNLIKGSLVHNQMVELPDTFDNVKKTQNQLPIDPNAGLAHQTCFIYDTELKILMLESKQNGVSSNGFCEFFEENYKISKIVLNQVINPEELKKIHEMDIIKKIIVKVAKIENGTIFKSKRKSISNIIKSADKTNTTTLEYTLSTGLGNKSLNKSTIMDIINGFNPFKDSGEVIKLEITGRKEDENNEIIDFVTNRLRLKISAEVNRFSSNFSLLDKYSVMEKST